MTHYTKRSALPAVVVSSSSVRLASPKTQPEWLSSVKSAKESVV